MDDWYYYAAFSALFSGLYSFGLNCSATYGFNKDSINMLSSLYSTFFCVVCWIYTLPVIENIWLILFCAVANGIFHYMVIHIRLKALEYIDGALYFPLYKTFAPILALILALIFYAEIPNLSESIGIFIGLLVPLLLITKNEFHTQTNLRRGIELIFASCVLSMLLASLTRFLYRNDVNEFVYLSFMFGISSIVGMYRQRNSRTIFNWHFKEHLLSFTVGFLFFVAIATYFKANAGDFAVIYTINSFHIVIPFVLSVVVLKERCTWQRLAAIVLTISCLWFFRPL